jgi:hypothetical protein
MALYIVCGHLVYFSRFGMFGPRKIWQPWTIFIWRCFIYFPGFHGGRVVDGVVVRGLKEGPEDGGGVGAAGAGTFSVGPDVTWDRYFLLKTLLNFWHKPMISGC